MEAVADADPQAQNVVGVELIIVEDVVEVGLGPHKELPQEAIANAGSGVNQKMIAVQVSGAPG